MEKPTRAKIVATLGPATDSPEIVRRLIEAGVSVFRLNFSHGTFDDHARRLEMVRESALALRTPTGVMGDLQGPKIRIGRVGGEGIMLEMGTEVVFRRGFGDAEREGEAAVFGTTYDAMIDEVEPGQRVLINDGAIRMLAFEKNDALTELRCLVTIGGLVTSGKGINLPETDVKAPAITARDWECVAWAVEHGLDFLALSFVRRAEEVIELRERLRGMCSVDRERSEGGGARIPVVAKIEKPQALENIEGIVDAADMVMVARGDLGVEMDIAKTPIAQKRIIRECERYGKPCIVATQMLESMIESASPTRAEASDVANAVFDGADAVMLSGETAVGRHPQVVVETMRRIVAEAEGAIELGAAPKPPAKLVESRLRTAALAHGAWHVARDMGAKVIVCWSEHGGTARYLSQNDFGIPIVAWSSRRVWTRRMSMLKNVIPMRSDPPGDGTLSAWTDMVEAWLLEKGLAEVGDCAVLLAGKPLGTAKATNTIAVLEVGDPFGGYRSHAGEQ